MKIVMLHGIWDTGSIYHRMARQLSRQGHECYSPDMEPANAAHGLHHLAEQVCERINERFGRDEPLALVGFSMGCLIARIYLQLLGGAPRSSHFFAISGPHHGTLNAYFWPGKAARDMRFGSDLLKTLNSDLTAYDHIEVHSYRTPYDLMILPSSSSKIAWGENHCVAAAFHHRMPVQTKIIEHISRVLQQA